MNTTTIKQAEVLRRNGEKVTITLADSGTNGPVNRWTISTSYGGGSASRSRKIADKKFAACVKYFQSN